MKFEENNNKNLQCSHSNDTQASNTNSAADIYHQRTIKYFCAAAAAATALPSWGCFVLPLPPLSVFYSLHLPSVSELESSSLLHFHKHNQYSQDLSAAKAVNYLLSATNLTLVHKLCLFLHLPVLTAFSKYHRAPKSKDCHKLATFISLPD